MKKPEPYINYPEQPNIDTNIVSSSETENANNSYASILLFLQNNPSKSAKFISDIKTKFFNDSCTVKNNIDFNNLVNMPFGMPF